MTDSIERTLHRLDGQLPGRVSRPGDNRYIPATALWAKPIGRMPRAVVHCRTPQDVQLAILAARKSSSSRDFQFRSRSDAHIFVIIWKLRPASADRGTRRAPGAGMVACNRLINGDDHEDDFQRAGCAACHSRAILGQGAARRFEVLVGGLHDLAHPASGDR